MADLGKNSLWSGLQERGTNVLDRITGKPVNYSALVKTPDALGVGSDGDISQVFTNAAAVGSYVQQLTTGPLLGNSSFVETGGMCRAPNGTVVPRWSYVNNRMRGMDVLPDNMVSVLGSSADSFNGIIPGMFGDIKAMNPVTPLNALILDGVPPCRAFSCPVTDENGNNERAESRFMNYDLETSMNRCTMATNEAELEEIEAEKLKKAEKESFGDQFMPSWYVAKPFKFAENTDLTPYVFLGLAVLVALGALSKKI
jgi:hypothetical protein